MATYNGANFIEAQIDSILNQIALDDELIIVDDHSSDGTPEILTTYASKNKNINIIFNVVNRGALKSFGNALEMSSGDVIFLADQDDVWVKDKVRLMLAEIRKTSRALVVSDATVIDRDGATMEQSFFALRKSGSGFIKNFYKNTYLGCCMLFDASLKEVILPLPDDVAQHDEWIGLVCELIGGSVFLGDSLLLYRRHDKNVSSFQRFPLQRVIVNRLKMFLALLSRSYKIYRRHRAWRGL
ncbi:glycosyltransferase family 2 protein [Deinococcus sp.]|uniref:glycosyltransferase family 2 protein n=1 Tax=Deinococcus sp. TaxID=47478 RepID=UPI003C7DD29B